MTDTLPLPAPFNPDLTLCGGQAFRWTKDPAGPACQPAYQGVVGDMVVRLTPPASSDAAPGNVASGHWHIQILNHPLTPARQQQLRAYFDLDRDYTTAHQAVIARLAALQHHGQRPETTFQANDSADEPANAPKRLPADSFPAAVSFTPDWRHLTGLRLLRQPWFEVMVSFVISSNNHLPRIRQIINVISRTFGQPITPTDYAFPTPEALAAASPTTLRHTCRVGYRDHALHQLATQIAHNLTFWETAATCPTPELRRHLLTLPGVGPKVAECILLFGFHRWEAFPIDVWVRRVLLACLGRPTAPPPADRELAALAANTFGPFAGLAQQYLFELARLHLPRRPKPSAAPDEG
ncbi:DNA-3-methyladenine glycosylase [Chloracidobacterium thermophilum]|uniref:DNA-3-methyladenine glycosylase family protein n=1 Tax=Chloracidobacterium thermophilum TaxID=458033 RepID=UPI00073886C2|nr:DNA glycosylase [Chloracidobacterium thermophilum]